MPNVYVVQNSLRRDDAGQMVPKHDGVERAAIFGDLVTLVGPSAAPWDRGVIDEISSKLRAFNENDHLVLIGSPILIAQAFAIAANNNAGRVKVLQWDGRRFSYFSVQCDLGWDTDR